MNRKKSNFFIDTWNSVKKSFEEFLKVPSIIILSFLLLALVTNLLDHSGFSWLSPVRSFMNNKIFSDPKGTSSLLSAIGGSLITVSSLTITLLLLVVQQSASAMTTRVFDQFLRNRINQAYFGFFVGLAIYCLIILATVAAPFNPIIGATVALLLTILALYFLLVLIYTTINEMRPPVIIEAIFQNILKARKNELTLLGRTRRTAEFEGKITQSLKSDTYGYLANINLNPIKNALQSSEGDAEIVYCISVGDYVAVHDVFAEVKTCFDKDCEQICDAVIRATDIQKQRKSVDDPGDTIEQLEIIAWTSISTAKSDPYPGLLAIRTFRNLLSVWDDESMDKKEKVFPVVYNTQSRSRLFNAMETLAVVSSESMQHMVFTEVLRNFSLLFNRLDTSGQQRVEDIVQRIISCMGDFVLTAPLEQALEQLAAVLKHHNRPSTARKVLKAKEQLASSVGELNSRSTRTGK